MSRLHPNWTQLAPYERNTLFAYVQNDTHSPDKVATSILWLHSVNSFGGDNSYYHSEVASTIANEIDVANDALWIVVAF
jgi:hypothetical protein